MELQVAHLMLLQNEGFELLCRGFESPERDLNFASMSDSNSLLKDSNRFIWPSVFTFAKGFESITRRFELPCLVLHDSRFRDSNRCVGDSNPCFNLYTCSLWGIRITVWVIWIGGSLLHFFFHQGFESLCRGFESLLQSLFMFFMRDSNHWMGDSNRWLSTSLLSS